MDGRNCSRALIPNMSGILLGAADHHSEYIVPSRLFLSDPLRTS